jgi:hypothetical protein
MTENSIHKLRFIAPLPLIYRERNTSVLWTCVCPSLVTSGSTCIVQCWRYVFWGVTRVDWYTVLWLLGAEYEATTIFQNVCNYQPTRRNTSKDPNLQQHPWVHQVSTKHHLKFVIFDFLAIRTSDSKKNLMWKRYKCHLMYNTEWFVYVEIKKAYKFWI